MVDCGLVVYLVPHILVPMVEHMVFLVLLDLLATPPQDQIPIHGTHAWFNNIFLMLVDLLILKVDIISREFYIWSMDIQVLDSLLDLLDLVTGKMVLFHITLDLVQEVVIVPSSLDL